jgi:hypothetical protein
MHRAQRALAVLALAGAALFPGTLPAAPPAIGATGAICDGSTALTLLGMDTASGRMLFSVPPLPGLSGQGGRGWLVELDAEGREARAWPDPPKGLFGGSVGPGAVVAALPCGTSCLQPVRWSDGAWEPLGDPLTAPTASTVMPTYDNTGAPWFLLHGPGPQEGQVRAWAFRLEGHEWKSRGALIVSAVGQPAALPAPQRKDGVLSGTGLFSSSGRPEIWVAGLPALSAERRGQLLALTGTSVAYVSGDGVVYLSDDKGKTWRRSTWTPWGVQGTAGLWRQGHDFWVDLPFGDHRGALRLAWFDRRRPAEEKVLLTRLGQSGDWIRIAEAPGQVRSKSGEQLPVTQVVVPRGDTWLLLSGCAATATEGSGLVLRSYDGTAISPARFVPIHTAKP